MSLVNESKKNRSVLGGRNLAAATEMCVSSNRVRLDSRPLVPRSARGGKMCGNGCYYMIIYCVIVFYDVHITDVAAMNTYFKLQQLNN